MKKITFLFFFQKIVKEKRRKYLLLISCEQRLWNKKKLKITSGDNRNKEVDRREKARLACGNASKGENSCERHQLNGIDAGMKTWRELYEKRSWEKEKEEINKQMKSSWREALLSSLPFSLQNRKSIFSAGLQLRLNDEFPAIVLVIISN